uniref:Uncharacterized protein n=1 Tax=Solanum lycopersicum TaxID=4081 RepID=A0A3Q7EG45_SOLLC
MKIVRSMRGFRGKKKKHIKGKIVIHISPILFFSSWLLAAPSCALVGSRFSITILENSFALRYSGGLVVVTCRREPEMAQGTCAILSMHRSFTAPRFEALKPKYSGPQVLRICVGLHSVKV